jgi:hypothetical protein
MSLAAAVLAHQGGWDEMLMVLIPIGAFTLLLMLANRRAKAAQVARGAGGHPAASPAADDGPSGDRSTGPDATRD